MRPEQVEDGREPGGVRVRLDGVVELLCAQGSGLLEFGDLERERAGGGGRASRRAYRAKRELGQSGRTSTARLTSSNSLTVKSMPSSLDRAEI